MLYDIGLVLFRLYLGIASLFNKKIREGIEGRKGLFDEVGKHYEKLTTDRKRLLVHVSSFGELEQAKPVIELLKEQHPDLHIHLTFFSPSGYVNAKGKYHVPDLITYLPFDSKSQMRRFLDICQPSIVLFARYDVWHNLIRELHRRKVRSILFSATFATNLAKRLPLIKSFQRATYNYLTKIFCISEQVRSAFASYGVDESRLDICGDTRFDQVIRRKTLSKEQSIVSGFLQERLSDVKNFVVVAGSTWRSDIGVISLGLKDLLERHSNVYVVIAPHEVDEEHLKSLERIFPGASRLSYYNGARVIIVDSIGKLFELYRYAAIAYVGGGFGGGIHNVLEPTAWGVPIVVGPHRDRSQEAAELIARGAGHEVRDENSFAVAVYNLYTNDEARRTAGAAARHFVESRTGAADKIINDMKGVL